MASAQAQLEVRYMILSSSGSFLYLSFFLPLATYKVLCAQQLIALVSVASLGFLILTTVVLSRYHVFLVLSSKSLRPTVAPIPN